MNCHPPKNAEITRKDQSIYIMYAFCFAQVTEIYLDHPRPTLQSLWNGCWKIPATLATFEIPLNYRPKDLMIWWNISTLQLGWQEGLIGTGRVQRAPHRRTCKRRERTATQDLFFRTRMYLTSIGVDWPEFQRVHRRPGWNLFLLNHLCVRTFCRQLVWTDPFCRGQSFKNPTIVYRWDLYVEGLWKLFW